MRPSFACAVEDGYQEVRRAARGERRDYACDRLPFATGGQAEVFQAGHKPSGTVVVLKKLHQQHPAEHPIARMRREVYIGRGLDGHPHVMPVLDASADGTWFVMPLAEATAEERREELQAPGALRALVEAPESVLSAIPEEAGYIGTSGPRTSSCWTGGGGPAGSADTARSCAPATSHRARMGP